MDNGLSINGLSKLHTEVETNGPVDTQHKVEKFKLKPVDLHWHTAAC